MKKIIYLSALDRLGYASNTILGNSFNPYILGTRYYPNIQPFIITDNSDYSSNSYKYTYECNIAGIPNICQFYFISRKKNDISTVYINYKNTQKRDLFLFLYENLMNECYTKDEYARLIIKFYLGDMEYTHYLFFYDAGLIPLRQGKQNDAYTYETLASSLNTGKFSLFSNIPELSEYYNPINHKSL